MKPERRLRELLPYFRPYRVQVAVGMFAIVAAAFLGLLVPPVVGGAIDALVGKPDPGRLTVAAWVLVGLTALQGIFSFLQRHVLVAVSRRIEFEIRQQLFRHLETLQPAFFRSHRLGDLLSRATADLAAVRMVCGPALMYSTHTVVTAIGALAGMLWLDLHLSLLVLLAFAVVAVVTRVFGRKIHRLFERSQQELANLTARIQESLAGVRIIRAHARETAELASFDRYNEANFQANLALARWQTGLHPALQGLVGLAFVLVLGLGGQRVLAGNLTVGNLVAFHFFLAKLVWPMIATGWVINLLERASASWNRLLELFDEQPLIRDRPGIQDPGPLEGSISVVDLTFQYRPNGPRVLEGVSFEVAPGSMLGIAGRTGSGKSTLLTLLARLEESPRGSIEIGGMPLEELPLARLRETVTFVPQEPFLFSTTLAENIAFGKPEASREELERVADLAGLRPDLAEWPQGLDTRVGERGVTLSGGQKQRVALARALLLNRPVLLLDDALSALDSETEAWVLEHLSRLRGQTTVVLVAHRPSTLVRADNILVLDRGRIVEQGSHEELLARGGLYSELVRLASLEEEVELVKP